MPFETLYELMWRSFYTQNSIVSFFFLKENTHGIWFAWFKIWVEYWAALQWRWGFLVHGLRCCGDESSLVHCNLYSVSFWNSLGYFNQSLSWIPLQFVLRLRSGYTSSLSARVYLTIYYTLWVFTEQDLHIKNTLAILCLYLDWSKAVLKKKFTLVYLYLHDEKIYIFLLTKQLKIGLVWVGVLR